MNDSARLGALIASRHPCVTLQTFEEDYALQLVREAALLAGRACWLWSANGGLRDGLVSGQPPVADTEHPAAALFAAMQNPSADVFIFLDLAGHLRDEKTLRLLRDLANHCRRTDATLVLIDHRCDLPDVIRQVAMPFDISLPQEKELETLVRDTICRHHQVKKVDAQLSKTMLKTLLRNLQGLTRRQVEQVITDCIIEDRKLDAADLNSVLARKRQLLAREGLLEFVETPADLSEIGGLRKLKHWLKVRQRSLSDEAAEFGLAPPRGVLMLGVQGAGKSLCAKAIATAWQRPLLRMEVGVLYDRYVGETERRLREALQQAERMAPIVLWIDEVEKAFASAASHSTDGGLSQRMFGTLLTWMQEHSAPVFLVATANDIEALPPELLRKGRFDEIFFVDLPAKAVRKQIFAIHLRRRQRDPATIDLDALADASEGFSGAEIEQAVVAALHEAFADGGALSTAGIIHALQQSPPLSVTMAEKVLAVRAWAQGRCCPAD